MFINYKQNIPADPTLINVGTNLQSLITCGQKTTSGAPDTTSGKYIPSCFIQNLADSTLYVNIGSTASPSWSIVDAGVSGITALTGDVTATGPGSAVATIAALHGSKLNSSVGTPFTNEVLQYSGNPAIGWVNAAHIIGTASGGSVTFGGGQIGTNFIITTDSLVTAAGGIYTLQIISTYLTSATNPVAMVTYGTSTTGTPQIISYTQTGGSLTLTIKNIDPVNPFNGTLKVNMFGF